ncbi:MAG: hypothetical protein KDH95_21745 [Calditrichaeota bacterium]|nr:hypothetical protein [Calditrichota bacterium]MCB0270797.1 hypothetical protein [Calditrichota bacterium]
MILNTFKIKMYFTVGVLSFVIVTSGCIRMSEQIRDKSAGLNGSFEISENGLPVNWLMYTPNTVPDADFQIILDKESYKDGKQSLKFEIKRCLPTGGRHSPGFTNEWFDKKEGRYLISFWIKTSGTAYRIRAGGVEAKSGDMRTLIDGYEKIDDWKYLKYEIVVPKGRWLRMELNILNAGQFWIDNVKIEKINENT